MMQEYCKVIIIVALVNILSITSVLSQNSSDTKKKAPATDILRTSDSVSEVRARKNAWTVGIATGQIEASYPPLAQDLTKVLDDGENLRILPVITYGSVGNVEDLLYLNNIDMAFTKSDSFEYFKGKPNIGNLHKTIHYIARLYDAEMHILARPEIKSLKDLEGKTVNLGLQGNAANVTAPIMFERLGIKNVKTIFVDHDIGIEMLKKGKIAAALRVAGKPARTFLKVPEGSNFHFLPITSTEYATKLSDLYVLGQLTHQDYPNIIAKGKSVSTFGVPDILVTYNWRPNTNRFRRVERFVQRFFEKFEQLQKPPFHKKWRDVNLGASLRGEWKRFIVAERMLRKKRVSGGRRKSDELLQFERYLKAQKSLNKKLTSAERELLFFEFRKWVNKNK